MMIIALILAAGQSKRMGQPKMALPWGNTTVLGQVIQTLQSAEIKNILAVTGGAQQEVEQIAADHAIQTIHNPKFDNGDMLTSLQAGLWAITAPTYSFHQATRSREREATLIVLGDQPQIEARSVRAVVGRFAEQESSLVVPSFQMRRGHPWLVARPLWMEILQMRPPQSPRDFLNAHAHEIDYVNVDSPSILADLDTPEDYLKSRP